MPVVSQGREPRRTVALRPAFGARQVVTVLYTSTVSLEEGGQTRSAPPSPSTKLTFSSQIHSITSEGGIRYDFAIEHAELLVSPGTPAEAIDEVRSSVAILPGLKGKGRADRDGSALELDFPANVPTSRRGELSELAASLRFMGSPFPREPIGPGARWEQPISSQGPLGASGSTSFELVSFDGNRVLTRALVEQTPRPQAVPPEYRTRVGAAERMIVRSRTKAETLFGLDRLWPIHAELRTRTQADLSAEEEEPPRRLRIITVTRVRMDETPSPRNLRPGFSENP